MAGLMIAVPKGSERVRMRTTTYNDLERSIRMDMFLEPGALRQTSAVRSSVRPCDDHVAPLPLRRAFKNQRNLFWLRDFSAELGGTDPPPRQV